MVTRRTILSAVAVVGVGLGLVTAVGAYAHGGPGMRNGAMMKRFVSSIIDEALVPAQISPEQRARIYAARDRAFAAVEAHRQTPHYLAWKAASAGKVAATERFEPWAEGAVG